MGKKRHSVEQISILRQAEILSSQCKKVYELCRELGVDQLKKTYQVRFFQYPLSWQHDSYIYGFHIRSIFKSWFQRAFKMAYYAIAQFYKLNNPTGQWLSL